VTRRGIPLQDVQIGRSVSPTIPGEARTLPAVFVNSLLIKTGNLSAQAVCALLERNLSAIETVLETHTLIEIDQSTVKPVL
jgi:hypothetical protein